MKNGIERHSFKTTTNIYKRWIHIKQLSKTTSNFGGICDCLEPFPMQDDKDKSYLTKGKGDGRDKNSLVIEVSFDDIT